MATSHPAGAAPATRRARRIERSKWSPTVGPGMVLGVLGTAGVVVSMFLPWQNGAHPSDIPIAFLFDHTTTSTSPSLLLALIPLAVIMGIGALLPRAGAARVIGSLLVLVVVGLFAWQLHEALDDLGGGSIWDAFDSGVYVAAIAGLVGLVSGFMPSGWSRRRWSETDADYGDVDADGRAF
jgi:hypothetical protein